MRYGRPLTIAGMLAALAGCGGGSDSDSAGQLLELSIDICDPTTQSFSTTIDNPYFPLPVGRRLVLEGDDEGEALRVEIDVLDTTEDVAGVTTKVVTETEFKDGELFERTFNYFSQAPDGTVCYFGEDVEFYEGGVLVGSEGTWRADLGAKLPGIQMPAAPAVDTWFYQEFAPGLAEDKSLVAELGVATHPGRRFRRYAGVHRLEPARRGLLPRRRREALRLGRGPGEGRAARTDRHGVSLVRHGVSVVSIDDTPYNGIESNRSEEQCACWLSSSHRPRAT